MPLQPLCCSHCSRDSELNIILNKEGHARRINVRNKTGMLLVALRCQKKVIPHRHSIGGYWGVLIRMIGGAVE